MSERILVGTRKGLFTLDRTGTNGCPWTITRAAFIGDAVSMVLAEPDTDRVHAALDHGHFGVKMHRSSDNGANGATWQEIAAPMYPERPADAEDLDPIRNEPIPWSTKLIWSLEAGHPDQPGILWCGTIPGGLFRSDDGGDSWDLVRSLWDHPRRKQWFGGGTDLPGIHSIIVDPRDGNHVTVGVSCGGVWMTFDGGATWECRAEGMWAAYMPPDLKHDPYVQDPHRVVQCLAQPDYLWAQHHNGVFRTTSGAVSWEDVTSVEPSVAGFTGCCSPLRPQYRVVRPDGER